LEASLGPLPATAVLALLWVGWHLPLFLMPGWTSSPLWVYILILLGVSVIMSLTANIGNFSVIPVIAAHAAFNTVPRFLNGLFTAVQPSVHIPFELVLALCGLGMGVILVCTTKARLAYTRVSIDRKP
jgi:hypothetical protein